MAAAQVLIAIGIIVLSFVIGIVFFYSMSSLSKEEKKKSIDEVVSLLINFVIFVWIAKIVLNIGLFVKDPFAVLAYPSNSQAFYLATLFIGINIIYKIKRHDFKITPVIITFIPLFLFSSLTYEFIQMVFVKSTYSWYYLVLLMGLVILYVSLNDRMNSIKSALNLMLLWTMGTLLLALLLPFTTVFGYTMSPWYLIALGVIQLIGIILNFRRRR